jgi:C_GCAxxG_C_C family probable redox protein
MDHPTDRFADDAVRHFDKGFNCAESSLLGLAEYLGIDSPVIPMIASAFGGGIARSQSLCGALAGSIMGLGLKFGRRSPEEERTIIYQRTEELVAAFRERFHTVSCRELTGIDFKNTEEFQNRYPRVHAEVCSPIVRFAVERTIAIFNRS